MAKKKDAFSVEVDAVVRHDYECAECHGIYEKAWSDEEAIQEKEALFPNVNIEDCEIVCDDCFNNIIKKINA